MAEDQLAQVSDCKAPDRKGDGTGLVIPLVWIVSTELKIGCQANPDFVLGRFASNTS